MELILNCKFLSSEIKTSKKGNDYSVITVLQGTETITMMSNDLITCDFGQDITLLIEFNVKYKQLKVIDVK